MEYSGYLALNSNYLIGELDLKQISLLFDSIYYDEAELNECIESISHRIEAGLTFKNNTQENIVDVINSRVADIEYLSDRGILKRIDPLKIEERYITQYPNSNYSGFLKSFYKNTNTSYLQAGSLMSSMISLSILSDRDLFNSNYENSRAVSISDILGILENKIITPIFNPTGWKIKDAENYSMDQNVLEVVISKFPTIENKNISWERFLDFKNESETKTNKMRIRNWMIDIAKANLKINEIQQKLEYMLNEYEVYLKRHGFEFKYSILKDVLITTSEVVEKLITLKLSGAVKTIFNVGSHKMKLIDIKENAPGKEVALYHQVNTLLK